MRGSGTITIVAQDLIDVDDGTLSIVHYRDACGAGTTIGTADELAEYWRSLGWTVRRDPWRDVQLRNGKKYDEQNAPYNEEASKQLLAALSGERARGYENGLGYHPSRGEKH